MSLQWKHVRYFKQYEFDDPKYPGSGQYINGILLICLDKLRHDTGWAIMPNWKVGGCVDMKGDHGHSKDSYHLYSKGCKATDFYFADPVSYKPINVPIIEQFSKLIQSGLFDGVGVYPDWLTPGFHVDVGRVEPLYWVRKNDKYYYFRSPL